MPCSDLTVTRDLFEIAAAASIIAANLTILQKKI
jgi:hypothetical protein